MQKLMERVEEVERVNAKLEVKEKEKKLKFSKSGCETQFKFNSKIKDLWGDELRVELKKHFKEGLPEKIEGLVKEGEKEIDDQNHKLKIADEFGFPALDDFIKEDLARDEKEEKKIKALKKDKKEKEEKSRSRRGRGGYASGKGGFRGFSFRGFSSRDRNFYGRRSNKGTDSLKDKEDIKCFNCQSLGHMARDCVKPSSGGRGRR